MLVFKEEILRNLKALNVLNSWGEKKTELFFVGAGGIMSDELYIVYHMYEYTAIIVTSLSWLGF